jgi:HlyD family secretion protein
LRRRTRETTVATMKKLGIALVLVAAVIAAATLWRDGAEDTPAVRVVPVVERGVTSRVLAQGRVRARTQVEVSSEVAGRVAVVAVEVGARVNKGDLLFSLDGEQLKNAVEQITAALSAAEALVARADVAVKEAERGLERDRGLAGKNVLPEDTLRLGESRVAGAHAERAQAQANVDRARIDLERARDALRRARVTAPQAGTVVAVGVEVGKVVSAGTGLSASPDAALGLGIGGVSAPVIIADLGELIVKLDVDELDIARVKAGQHAVVRAQGIKDIAFDGVVEKVGLLGKDAMGAVQFSVDVRVTNSREPPPRDGEAASAVVENKAARVLPAPAEVLRPGMTASAEIEVEHLDQALVVPLAAVLEATRGDDGDKPDRVFVVDGAEAGPDAGPGAVADTAAAPAGPRKKGVLVVHETPVRLGPADGDGIAVLDGLRAGQRIVEGPFRALKLLEEGSKVSELDDDDGKKGAKKKAPASQKQAP